MKGEAGEQILVVSRRSVAGRVPLRGRFRKAGRLHVRTARQALRKARNAGVGGVVVDLGFRDGGMDGMELALLLVDLYRGKPVWVAALGGDARAQALSLAFSKKERSRTP